MGNYLERYPHLREIEHEFLEGRLDLAEDNIDDAMENGSLPATIFFLNKRGGSRNYGDRTELSGPRGQPILVSAKVLNLTAEDISAA